MTVLKRDSGSAMRVMRFAGAPATALPGPDPFDEAAQLRRAIAAIEQALADAVADGEAACAEARAQGRAEGYAQHESREAERVAAVQEGIAQALAIFAERLAGERDLAIDIAQATLAAMIGDALPHRELVAATATHHAATLARETIVRLRVSAADFPDADAQAALHRLDWRIDVDPDPSLTSGTCRFELTLGALDAGIATQAKAAADLLDRARRGTGDGQ